MKKREKEHIRVLGQSCILSIFCTSYREKTFKRTIFTLENDKKSKTIAEKLELLSYSNSNDVLMELENESLFNLNEDLFNLKLILFNNFVPLYLCRKVQISLFNIIRKESALKKYIEPIERETCKKLLCQVSLMYKTITYPRLLKMIFKHWFQEKTENLVLELAHKKDIWCCMAHGQGILDFTPPNRLERSYFLKNHLSKLSNNLNNIYDLIGQKTTNLDVIRKNIFNEMRQTLKRDLENVEKRQQLIKNIRHQEDSKRRKKKDALMAKERQEEIIRKKKFQINKKKIHYVRKKGIEREKKEIKERENTINFLNKAHEDLEKVGKFHGIVKKDSQRQMLESLIKKTTNSTEQHVENASKNIRKAVDTKMTEFYRKVKYELEKRKTIEYKEMDYLVRACREREISLLKKKQKQETENNSEKQKRMYKIYIQKLKENHKIKKQLKQDVKTYKKYTTYFLKMFELSQFDSYSLEKKQKKKKISKNLLLNV